MPELPEVEVVRAGLDPAVAGARIEAVEISDTRALTRHAAGALDFEASLLEQNLTGAVRRGKFLWVDVAPRRVGEPGTALLAHLGMSGQLLLRAPGAPRERHERVRIALSHPVHGEIAIVFADQRTFGSLAVDEYVATRDGCPGGYGSSRAVLPSQAAHIARDPLDPSFDARAFEFMLARKGSAIKRVLLDQNVVSGIGNIYADESLWAARIHPEQPARALSTQTIEVLLAEVRAVLHKALAEGGTSFDAQYVNVNGQAGYFSHSLHVYGRQGEPCDRCGTPIVRGSFMNRGSHFCPQCQRRRG